MTVKALSKSPSKAFLASPALHFLVLGLTLLLLQGVSDSGSDSDVRVGAARSAPILIGADRISRLRRGYAESFAAQPDTDTLKRMIEEEIDDEILYREALAIGMDEKDPVVYQRMLEKMEFLGERREGEDDQQTFERALALGLQSQDPIVRNTLIRKITTWIRFATNDEPADDAELADYQARHAAEYHRPDAIGFVHVFFSNDKHGGEAAEQAAIAALTTLRALPTSADPTKTRLGDPFLQGAVQSVQSQTAIARNFGEDFAHAVSSLEPKVWTGPLRSPYGFHLVFVSSRRTGGQKDFESVRSQLVKGRETERREIRLAKRLAELRANYTITVAPLDEDASGAS